MIAATQKSKGPATAPTVPGHGPSSIPRKDTEMNERMNITAGAVAPDPLLQTIRLYQRGLLDFNALAVGDIDWSKVADETYGPHLQTLSEWDKPAATFEGAVEALRISLTEEDGVYGCDAADRMVRAAYAFLKEAEA